MKYVIELDFKSGVHFGSDIAGYGVEEVQGFAHSDTIFSALINTLASVRHEFDSNQWVKDFFSTTHKDIHVPFKVSSFGFVDTSESSHKYYIPKPLLFPQNLDDEKQKTEFGKDFKQLKFISINTFYDWQRNNPLNLGNILEGDRSTFWVEEAKTQHLTDSLTLATQIYRTGLVFYLDFIKPFFIVELDEEQFSFDDFKKLLHVMKYNGLGGRRTSGCGLFEFSDKDWFCIDIDEVSEQKKSNPSFAYVKNQGRAKFKEICSFSSENYYLFSAFYPSDIRLVKPLHYELIQRKGWIFSTSSYKQLKRKTCYMFSEGSILTPGLSGKLIDVTPDEFEDHKIFRNGVPFMLPFREE